MRQNIKHNSFKMQQTSWLSRPVLALMLLTYTLTIVASSAAYFYDFRENRQKRSLYTHLDQTQIDDKEKTSNEFKAAAERIFILGKGPGMVIFNDSSQPTFKVQRSPDGKLNVVFNDFLIFQTTTSATPTNNKNYSTIINNNNNNIKPPNNNDGTVTFPDDINNCPERRQGKSYCTNVPNYLELSKVDKISPEQFTQFKSYFRDDFIIPNDITERINTESLEEYYCQSKSRLVYPQKAETRESTWLWIVQNDTKKQGVLVEECEEENKACRFENTLPLSYKSKCKQNFVFRNMIVLKNGEMKEEQVKLPSCCKCVLWNTKTPA